jgi:predicted P-loop ATPase
MTQQHPITPPPELVEQWMQDHATRYDLARQAAQYGADQELEACCEWLQDPDLNVDTYKLRAARRSKPPSLKEQALLALSHLLDGAAHSMDTTEPADYIRRALEQLPE